MTEKKCLTTREVARLCRVSDATVKRWAESGLLESERTGGGHRRFRAEEIARFQREHNIGLKKSHGDESALTLTPRRSNKNYPDSPIFRALVAGCETEASNILINAYLHGDAPAKIFDTLLCGALRAVGELWYRGELSIAQEHLAARTTFNAVYKFRSVLPIADITGETAMCCALEGDLHELPTHLSQLVFENEGFEVINFGANTPLYSLTEEVGRYAPNLICISAMILTDIERLARDYREFRERIAKLKTPIILGGRAFNDEYVRQRFPADLYAGNFEDAANFARQIAARSRIS